MNTKSCEIEGCCAPNKKFEKFNSPLELNKTDANFPPFTFDVLRLVCNIPIVIYLVIRSLVLHSVGHLRRESWGFSVYSTVSVFYALRDCYSGGGILLWRTILSAGKLLNSRDAFIPSPFKAEKLGLVGILEELDNLENGTRDIEADWVIDHKMRNPENEKVFLYVHGGGYCLKDWSGFIRVPIKLAKHTQNNVFCVSYRLAPETRLPGQLYDVVQAYFHLINHYRINPKNIIILGESSGGGLLVSLLVYLRDHGYPLPGLGIGLSPWLDISYSHDSWKADSTLDYMLTKPHRDNLNPGMCFVGPQNYHNLKYHPYASPLHFENINNLPPLLIQSGDSEVMRDEIRHFVNKHKEGNTLIQHEEYKDMVHDFFVFDSNQSHMAFLNIQRFIKENL